MIGINYLLRLSQILAQSCPGAAWLDKKTSFDFLFEAAKDYAKKTRCLCSTQSITTVSGVAYYALNPDFQKVFTEKSTDAKKKVIKYA